MEELNQVLILVGGVLLRFGIPILGTGLLVFLLKQLDRRWQKQSTVQAGVRNVYNAAGQQPCWDQQQCSPERRAKCPAFQNTRQPCWQLARQGNGNLKEECLTCDVFTGFPVLAPA